MICKCKCCQSEFEVDKNKVVYRGCFIISGNKCPYCGVYNAFFSEANWGTKYKKGLQDNIRIVEDNENE